MTIDSMNLTPCADSRFSVVVRECDEICHIELNECLEFIDISQCLNVLEEKSCRRDSFSREVNFLLNT